ncbi:MAG: hypothetical protein AAF919_02075 [Pseudomonadota bacterium]
MSRAPGQSLGDLIGIAVALWVLLGDPFPDVEGNVLRLIAFAVIGLSLWRLWSRWRASR